ncbi:MAG: serine hydrolase [Clostridiales bacterium]|nr:serine hydrolase [Clostridiales bacterium]
MVDYTVITPEEAGVPSSAVRRFAARLESRHINFHSFVMTRRGKLFAECYCDPWKPEDRHRMYSSSKTFASAGIGLMIGEGKVRLDDRVFDFFPEYVSEPVSPYLAETTVRDLLMMATPYQWNNYGFSDKNWVQTFFDPDSSVNKHRADHRPGRLFQYNTCATVVLTAIVEKLAGCCLTDYLRPRLFEPLGMTPDIRCVKRPEGGDWAGSGILCTTRDLARFTELWMRKGRWNGVQILPEDYAAAATSKQIDTVMAESQSEEQFGYGYQIWMTRHRGFALLGMGLQCAVCLPEKDFVIAVTGDTQATPVGYYEFISALWREIYPYLGSDAKLEPNESAAADLADYLSTRHVLYPRGEPTSPTAALVSGKKYVFNANPMGIRSAVFTFEDGKGSMSYENRTGNHVLEFGFGSHIAGFFPETHYHGEKIGTPLGRGYKTVSSAAWADPETLHIVVYSVDDYLGTLKIQAAFGGDGCTLYMVKAAEDFFNEYQGLAEGITE